MKKKILNNILASLLLEIVTVVCSFILPRLIISNFGSEYNGIVASVTQFLSVVTLLRGGVGGVTRAALYRPLVENDVNKISAILKSTEHFMRKIAYIFVAFLLLLSIGYPLLVAKEFDWFYTFSLVLILGITTVSQYYFGITYQFLLSADQKSYVYNILQTIATILNTLFSVLLINAGVEFRVMKLVSALIFAAIPMTLYWYVHSHYKLQKGVERDDTYIKQRWDAFVHQIAAFIHSNTDIMLLTVFSNLYQVSVYNVYYMVVQGVKKFVTVFTSGIESTIGKMLAGKDKQLSLFFGVYEWGINVISIVAFVSTAVLIVPFMNVYMKGVTDTNYTQPMLGYCLAFGSFLSCIRLPYQSIIESAGHFRETRVGAIIEAAINIGVSLVLIRPFGAVGVVLGTVFAMAFRTVQYAIYSYKYILKKYTWQFVKRMLVTGINITVIMVPFLAYGMDKILKDYSTSYFIWGLEAIFVFVIITLVSLLINIIAYRKEFIRMIRLAVKSKKAE